MGGGIRAGGLSLVSSLFLCILFDRLFVRCFLLLEGDDR